MPKRPTAKAKKKTKQSTPKGITVKYEGTVPTVYANFASVTHTLQELIIDFCVVAPPFEVDPANQMITSKVSVRVITPLGFGSALIEAMNTRLKRAEAERSQEIKAS